MKPKVQRELLEDMQKYIKCLNPDDYESCSSESETDPVVIEFMRNYYDKHLPVDAEAWLRVNKIDDAFHDANALEEQVKFVQRVLCGFFMPFRMGYYYYKAQVIDYDYLNYQKIPVYQIAVKEWGIEIVLKKARNFSGWIVSVNSEKPLEIDCRNLFDPHEEYSADLTLDEDSDVFYVNLPEDKIYGTYAQNKSQFTTRVRDNYKLYTLFFLIKNCLESNYPFYNEKKKEEEEKKNMSNCYRPYNPESSLDRPDAYYHIDHEFDDECDYEGD